MQLWSRGVCVRFATFLKSSVKLSCSAAGSIIVVWREREREKRRNLQENNAENRRTQTEMAGVQTRGNTSFTVAECCRPMRPFYKRVKSQQAGKLCFFPVLFLAVGEKAKHTHKHIYMHMTTYSQLYSNTCSASYFHVYGKILGFLPSGKSTDRTSVKNFISCCLQGTTTTIKVFMRRGII